MEVVDMCMLSNSHQGSFNKIMSTCLFPIYLFGLVQLTNCPTLILYNNLVKIKYILTFEYYAVALSKCYITLVYMRKSCQRAIWAVLVA